MTQATLPFRRTDPASSRLAASSGARRAGALRNMLLRTLERETHALSAEALARLVGRPAYEVRKRLPELEREGLAVAINRDVPNQPALLWRINERGVRNHA